MQTQICGLLCAITVLVSAASAEETHSKSRAFFAFDNGLRQTDGLEEKAALLAQLGYDGIAWRPGKTAEMLEALDRHRMKMFATYVTLSADEEACRVPPGVVREIEALKGRDTIVWLTIGGKTSDEVVVEGIRRVCGVAEENGLQVALAKEEPRIGVDSLVHRLGEVGEARLDRILSGLHRLHDRCPPAEVRTRVRITIGNVEQHDGRVFPSHGLLERARPAPPIQTFSVCASHARRYSMSLMGPNDARILRISLSPSPGFLLPRL